MSRRRAPAVVGCSAVAAAWLGAGAVLADGDEAWLHRAPLPADMRPLLAVILDRSQAAAASLPVVEDYDPARDYAASLPAATGCDVTKVWLRRGTEHLPDCTRLAGLDLTPGNPASGVQCATARAALASSGFYVASRASQWRIGPGGGHWDAPRPGDIGAVECRADRGVHGSAAGGWYAADGGDAAWTREASLEIPWDRAPFADPYVFLAGNYLNYLRSATAPTAQPIADVMSRRLADALAATSELDVALLRVDDDGPDGGFVARAPVPAADAAAELRILAATPQAGAAPLAETLTEAARWLAGGPRLFGIDARTDPAALEPPGTGTYRSPFEHACRPVSLAFLTAGQASDDDQGGTSASTLPRFVAETGGCGTDCPTALSDWLGRTDLRDDLAAVQSAVMTWVTPPDQAIAPVTRSHADPLAYVDLVVAAHQRDTAVAAKPQLSAAALMPFGPRAHAPAVIFGLTAPRARERWAGNLLQYGLRSPAGPLEPPVIVDREGEPAIGTDGLPRSGSTSLWSEAPDTDLLAGGAAGRLPPQESRRFFTNVASDRIVDPANRLEPGNPRIGRDALGMGAHDPESADGLLATFRSYRTLGDPGLHASAIADYPGEGVRIAYATTQDGLLHAVDADSGVELWAWMPRELLPRVPRLVRNAPTTSRSHGLEGPLVLHRHDPNGDGIIEPGIGEHLWLLFGLGRGGAHYYALDVSQPQEPTLLWSLQLPDAGVLALAEPVVARLRVADSGQGAGDWTVFLAGGYDNRFDTSHGSGTGAGGVLLAVDAETGNRLWAAGGNDAELAMPGLASLATAPRVLDLDGDGSVDRAYALDVIGDLWRIDFRSGNGADALASASRIGHLGGDGRRFHHAPDATVVRLGQRSQLALAFGSGSRMRPRAEAPVDALYVVYDTLTGLPSSDLAITDLHDATGSRNGIPPDARGWFLRLEEHGAGEKIAGPTVTFDHALRFQTYQPLPPDPAAPCGPPQSLARRYTVDIRTAAPRSTVAGPDDEVAEEMPASGLPPGLRFGFPGRWEDACSGCRPRPFGIQGGETFDTGYAGDPVRTSWRELVPPALP